MSETASAPEGNMPGINTARFLPSCTTVYPTWTRSRTGCLRPTQERTQYPIVRYKEVYRELRRSIFPQHDS